jgi:hypothetical protein
MIRRRIPFLRLIVIFVAVSVDPRALFSCSSSPAEIIYTHTVHPDFPLDRFARGELGALQPTYARSYLVAAYRHLNGVGVNPDGEKALVSLWSERLSAEDQTGAEKATEEWNAERKKIAAAGEQPPEIGFYSNSIGSFSYIINCQADAFKTAVRTLRERVKQFGAKSATVASWAQAQDQVFANCAGAAKIPAPAPADAQPPARADRAYQIAAANFYAGAYQEAERLFGEIANDKASPWRRIASLMVARALIRRATVNESNSEATLKQADAQLKLVLNDRSLISMRNSARRLRGFVLFRLDPEKRARELARAVMAKNAGASLKLDVGDYTRLLDRYQDADGNVSVPAPARRDDITDWIFTFQAKGDDGLQHSLQRWAQTSSPAWMLASLVKIHARHPKAAALLEAATNVKPDSPAFATAACHIVRLTLEAGHEDEARRKLDELLALEPPAPVSTRNQFLALRMKLARDVGEFFKFAPRPPAAVSYNDDGRELPTKESDANPPEKPFVAGRLSFDEDSTRIMNSAAPLAILKDAAMGNELPEHLRRQLAVAAWTRASLFDDDDTAKELAPALLALVPEMKAQLDDYLAAKDAAERKDAALYSILSFPACDLMSTSEWDG